MFKILSDHEKNRLYLYLSGNIDKRESRTALDKTIKSLEDLTPGFDLVSKVSRYNPLSQTADVTISSILKTVKEHGVRKTMTIVEEPNSETNVSVKYLLDDVGLSEYEFVDSVISAEEILESEKNRKIQ